MDTLSTSTEDMAYELAEYAFIHMPVRELTERYNGEWEGVHREYTSQPETLLRHMYYNLTGQHQLPANGEQTDAM